MYPFVVFLVSILSSGCVAYYDDNDCTQVYFGVKKSYERPKDIPDGVCPWCSPDLCETFLSGKSILEGAVPQEDKTDHIAEVHSNFAINKNSSVFDVCQANDGTCEMTHAWKKGDKTCICTHRIILMRVGKRYPATDENLNQLKDDKGHKMMCGYEEVRDRLAAKNFKFGKADEIHRGAKSVGRRHYKHTCDCTNSNVDQLGKPKVQVPACYWDFNDSEETDVVLVM